MYAMHTMYAYYAYKLRLFKFSCKAKRRDIIKNFIFITDIQEMISYSFLYLATTYSGIQ